MQFRWRTSNEVYREWQQRPGGTIEGYRGQRFEQTPLGRVSVFPDGLVTVEGRASALLHQDADDHTLLAPDQLIFSEQVTRSFAQQLGAAIPHAAPVALGQAPAVDVTLGRADLAAELRFSDPNEGSAFLHSLASLDVPWCKSRTDGRKGSHIETVSFHGANGKSISLRAYDKGVESGTERAGVRLRLERQKRWRKQVEVGLADFVVSDLRRIFLGREFARLTDLPYASVCDVPEALLVLGDHAASGALTACMHESLMGFVVGGHNVDHSRRTMYRRAAQLRDLGIYVDPASLERVEVPVGRYLQAVASAWPVAA